MGGGLQRAGARVGASAWFGELAGPDARGVGAPASAVFGRAHGSITLAENGAVATKGEGGGGFRSAASMVVMRSGRHFAQFTVVEGNYMYFGVIRPGWGVAGVNAMDEDGHCFYQTGGGRRHPGWINWGGMQGAREQGDRIGLLLDLDQGSMTVWKGDEKLGVMVAEGLTGPLCWGVSLYRGGSARIGSAALPAHD